MSRSPASCAEIGSLVTVKELGGHEAEVFRLGYVTKPIDNQLATDHAMGRALLGAQPGDEVTVVGPAGPVRFEVLDVRSEPSA